MDAQREVGVTEYHRKVAERIAAAQDVGYDKQSIEKVAAILAESDL